MYITPKEFIKTLDLVKKFPSSLVLLLGRMVYGENSDDIVFFFFASSLSVCMFRLLYIEKFSKWSNTQSWLGGSMLA